MKRADNARIDPQPGHYGRFSAGQAYRQLAHALRTRRSVKNIVEIRLNRLKRDEKRITDLIGPLQRKKILIIGPGQLLLEARYFAFNNDVIAVDLDVIPQSFSVLEYWRMLQSNGLGRFLKTAGRKLLGTDRAFLAEFRRALGVNHLPVLPVGTGDICETPLDENAYDAVLSWSVFQHLTNPEKGLRNVCLALRPGGAFYIGIHLYTCNTGHHDIRAFTGGGTNLPHWGHLRDDTRHRIRPSAFLNEWRLSAWRELFQQYAPGALEYLERYEEDKLRQHLDAGLRHELSDYSEEELLTVDAFYLWRKPGKCPAG